MEYHDELTASYNLLDEENKIKYRKWARGIAFLGKREALVAEQVRLLFREKPFLVFDELSAFEKLIVQRNYLKIITMDS